MVLKTNIIRGGNASCKPWVIHRGLDHHKENETPTNCKQDMCKVAVKDAFY